MTVVPSVKKLVSIEALTPFPMSVLRFTDI